MSLGEKPTSGICVSCACNGSVGNSEYRGIDMSTGELIFSIKLPGHTANTSVYCGVAHAIKYSIMHNKGEVIYTDNQTVLSWLKGRPSINDKIKYTQRQYIDRAYQFSKDNINKVQVSQWNTKSWDRIPSAYERFHYVK